MLITRLMELLDGFPADAEVLFTLDGFDDLDVLSVYPEGIGENINMHKVWVDLEILERADK